MLQQLTAEMQPQKIFNPPPGPNPGVASPGPGSVTRLAPRSLDTRVMVVTIVCTLGGKF